MPSFAVILVVTTASSTQQKEFSYSHVPQIGKYNFVYDKHHVKPLVDSKVECYEL